MSDLVEYGETFGSILENKFMPILDSEGKETDEKRFQPRFRFTEFAVDRHSEVVVPMGMDLRNWKANPQIFFGHGFGAIMSGGIPTIGNGVPSTIEKTDKFIDGDIFFDDDGTDEFATLVSLKVQKNLLRTSSIGFRSHKRSEPEDEPLIKGQKGVAHLKTELFELSIVPIPALTKARRLKHDEIRDQFNMFLGEAKDLGYPDIEEQAKYYAINKHLLPEDAAEFLGFGKKMIYGGKILDDTINKLNSAINALGNATEAYINVIDKLVDKYKLNNNHIEEKNIVLDDLIGVVERATASVKNLSALDVHNE